MKMTQYVNQSEVAPHGHYAPQVNYGQIQVSKNLLDKQPMPDIDVGGKWTSAIPGAVSSFGAGIIKGMQANAKEEGDKRKEAITQAENEFARKVREETARHAQSGGSLTVFENKIRTLGDQYLPLIGADKVAEISSKHTSGYLSLAEQGRKTVQTNALNNYYQGIKDYRAEHPESITLTDEEIGNSLLRVKSKATAAMDFNNNYKITGIDSYKQLAIDELAANIEPQLAERTKGMKNEEITQEWMQKQRQDLYRQAIDVGFTSDIAGVAIDRVFTSSWANTIAEGNSKWDKLTKEQRDTQADIIISGHKLDVLTGNPVNARLYSVLGPQGYAEMFKTYMQEDETASTTAKNAMVETLNSLSDSSKALTESQIDSISNHARLSGVLVKVANRKLTNGDGVANKYDAALVENTTRVVNNTTKNVDYTKPKEAEIALKNLSSLDIEALRNKAIFMSRSEIPEMAAQGRRLMVLTEANEAGRIAAKLSLPTYNVSASGYMKLMGSSAKERLRLDPNTGEFFLTKPQGFMQSGAQFIDNFTGLYDTYLKDTNNFINSNTDSMSIKKQIANLLGIKEETKEDADFTEMARQNDINWQNAEKEYKYGNEVGTLVSDQVAEEQGYYDLLDAPKDVYNFLKNAPTNIGRGVNKALGNVPEGYYEWKDSLPENLQNTSDYDLKGFYKKYGAADVEQGQHLTDEFKKPNHITFSKESKYYKEGMWAGEWTEDSFNIPEDTPEKKVEELKKYFESGAEPGYKLKMGDKVLVDSEPAYITEHRLPEGEEERKQYAEAGTKYLDIAAAKYNVNPNFLKGLAKAESDYGRSKKLKSETEVKGYMQITGETWNTWKPEEFTDHTGEDFFDPEKQVEVATRFAQHLQDKYKGDYAKAAAAYNAGEGVVDEAVKDAKLSGQPDDWKNPYRLAKYINYAKDPLKKAREINRQINVVSAEMKRLNKPILASASVSTTTPVANASVVDIEDYVDTVANKEPADIMKAGVYNLYYQDADKVDKLFKEKSDILKKLGIDKDAIKFKIIDNVDTRKGNNPKLVKELEDIVKQAEDWLDIDPEHDVEYKNGNLILKLHK